jgi:DNA-binding response OmpR family regulator/HPt (histidine-containing phosphotransfer) domain-containing protein
MRILLVEDDENLAKAMETILDQHNYLVDVAADGETAWEMADLVTYDLVLLDVGLPRLDGITLCRRFRARNPNLPIMLMTVRDSVADKITGLDSGADEYLVKPFNVQEFLARIRVLARRFSEQSDAILTFGNVRFNPQGREITCDGQTVPLSRKEYLLMELFLRHPYRVFSRSDIVEHLWSVDNMPTEDTVKSHIRRIRLKLHKLGAEDLIETLYGHGYRINPSFIEADVPEVSAPGDQASELNQATAEIWLQIRGSVFKQVDELEDAIGNLTARNASSGQHSSLGQGGKGARGQGSKRSGLKSGNGDTHPEPETLQVAQKTAHQIAGTVGTFGFDAASHIARAIEFLLEAPAPWQLQDSLQQLVGILRTELDHDGMSLK